MEKFLGQIHIGFRYSENFGPRSESAGVSLRFAASDTYGFVSEARWPDENFNTAVERGVRDGLVEAGFDPELGISVSLEDVEYDPVNSCERSFYVAAKCAAKARATISRRSTA